MEFLQRQEKLVLVSPGLGSGLSGTDNNSKRQNFWDKRIDFTGISFEKYKHQVDSLAIPIYIIHGSKDKKAPISQSHELLALIGNNSELEFIKNMGHKPSTKKQMYLRLEAINKVL